MFIDIKEDTANVHYITDVIDMSYLQMMARRLLWNKW